jgi:hypothetical protein
MSEYNDIKKLWKSADDQILENESLDSDMVSRAINAQSIGITSKLLKSIRAGIIALALCVPLFSYNIYSYSGNNLISIFSIGCLILSGLLLSYLIFQYNSFNKLDQSGLSLQDLIVAKIQYFKKSLYLVDQTIAISLVLLILSLNLLTDNNEGNYQVNNIWLYIGFIIAAYLIGVMMLHLSHNLYLKQYRTALDDLNKSKLTEMDAELRKQKWIRLFFLAIVLLSVIAGIIILFLKISGN